MNLYQKYNEALEKISEDTDGGSVRETWKAMDRINAEHGNQRKKSRVLHGIKGGLIGGAIGAIGGAAMSNKHFREPIAAGGIGGAIIGAKHSAGKASRHNKGIEEARQLMALPKSERNKYHRRLTDLGIRVNKNHKDYNA